MNDVEERNGQEIRDQSCDYILDSSTATLSLICLRSNSGSGFQGSLSPTTEWVIRVLKKKEKKRKNPKQQQNIHLLLPTQKYLPFHTQFSDEYIPLSSSLHRHTNTLWCQNPGQSAEVGRGDGKKKCLSQLKLVKKLM